MKCRNFSANLLRITAGSADVEFTVTHELNTTPKEAFVVRRGGNGDLYKGSTAWTDTSAYFKSTLANQDYYIIIFS